MLYSVYRMGEKIAVKEKEVHQAVIVPTVSEEDIDHLLGEDQDDVFDSLLSDIDDDGDVFGIENLLD